MIYNMLNDQSSLRLETYSLDSQRQTVMACMQPKAKENSTSVLYKIALCKNIINCYESPY